MFNCCGNDLKSIYENFDCQVKETEKGIQVDISPKDAAKTKFFKTLIGACKDFCECGK